MTQSVLLLTATIKPQSTEFLQLIDPNMRYKQYLQNLIRCIVSTSFHRIVFCENSLSLIPDRLYIEELCGLYGKEIEFLSFQGDQAMIEKLHRSYGDQEIMEYALDHSVFLQEAPTFYKLTGRYWVKNMQSLLKKWSNVDQVFVRGGLGAHTVHTAFFKTTPAYFRMHFYGKGPQLIQPFATRSLERLYYYYIKQSGIDMTVCGLHPEFSAEWGAGGRMDEYGWKKWKTKIFAKLGVYDIRTTKFQKGHPILKQ